MAILLNTLLRLGLVGVSAALLYWAGMRDLLLWGSAIILGFLLAFIFFRGPADAAARQLASLTGRKDSPPVKKSSGPSAEELEDAIVDGAAHLESETPDAAADDPSEDQSDPKDDRETNLK